MRTDQYDDSSDSYDAENASSLLNAYYERPAMIDLAGDVEGRRILDAGCGSGPLSVALRSKGAVLAGFDGSPANRAWMSGATRSLAWLIATWNSGVSPSARATPVAAPPMW